LTWKKNKTIFFLELFLGLTILAALGFLSLFFYYAKDFPRPEMFSERQLPESTKIYDRSGQTLLYEVYGEEKRTWVPLENIPESLKRAVITAEDNNFYQHFGIDVRGISRSIIEDLRIGQPVYGGSTIPQQLIRSTFLSNEKTAQRKIREIILAIELDRRYSKNQILEWYLNQVPFGQNAYGVEAASQTYFGKSISEISLPEAAMLASIIRAPYYLSPYGEHKNELLSVKDYVLERMKSLGYITLAESDDAKNEVLNFSEKPIQLRAPYFTLWIKQQLEDKYGDDFLVKGGLKVYTSLDWNMQKIAEKTVKEGVINNAVYNAHNAGLVAIDPGTGEVLAMTVGTGDYNEASFPENCHSGVDCMFDPKFNVVTGTKENPGRQPGSAFKPFVYAAAFQKGFDDKTVVIDDPTNFGVWGDKEYIPQNYDGRFRGAVNLRQSLAQSLNIPSVKVLLDLAGLEDAIKTAQSLGITTLNPPYGPSIVLGGWEVKLLDMTSAYGALANEGLRSPAISILKIEDQNGSVIFRNQNSPKRVLESQTARLINSILSDNEARAPIFGPRSPLYFENYRVAAKTGTTQDFRDGWVIGYTPSIVLGVWAGNNDNTPMAKEPGIVIAGPIFHNFLEAVLPRLPKKDFNSPEN